jgi:GcrA cell cycle regulator
MMWTWTDERVEVLRKLWTEGLSASQIAGELGGITRNAVIGKVHRLGLSGRAKAPSSGVARSRKPRTTVPSYTRTTARGMTRGNVALAPQTMAYAEVEAEPEPELVDNIIPMGQRCSILQLNEATCHWPIGDPSSPEFFFCGGKSVGGQPYCSHHCRMAYQPVQDRRRDRRPARVYPA